MKISVLMPVYNEAEFIVDAITSIFNYQYPQNVQVELVVVDDISFDDTFLIAKTLAAQKNWPVLVFKNEVKGKNNAFNSAFAASSGNFVCLMGGDDLMLPDVLVKRAHALLVDVGSSTSSHLLVSYCKLKTFSTNRKHDGIEIPKSAHVGSNSGGAVMMTRALANLIFPLPPHLPNEDSWITSYLIYMNVPGVHVPTVGLRYRIHSGNSHKRDLSLNDFKQQMWSRRRALVDFYVRYSTSLTAVNERQLLRDIVVEIGKYLGWGLCWLWLPGMEFKVKARAFSQSSRFGYFLRQLFYKYLSGR
jgi:glycosyltransferase involved in cell wall biosynthesis